MMWMLWMWACVPVAEVFDACDPAVDDTGVCVPCTTDEVCVLGGNSCLDTVACMHEDANVAFPAIGCSAALEHPWPDPEGCRCIDETCAWSP